MLLVWWLLLLVVVVVAFVASGVNREKYSPMGDLAQLMWHPHAATTTPSTSRHVKQLQPSHMHTLNPTPLNALTTRGPVPVVFTTRGPRPLRRV